MTGISDVLIAIGRLESKIDGLTRLIEGRRETVVNTEIPHMTTKQHAALQMMLAGASNAEIAKRFGVTENTAKVYVRTVAAKYGVHTRTQIVLKARDQIESLSEDEYRVLSGGLPKDWHRKFKTPDRYRELYYGGE